MCSRMWKLRALYLVLLTFGCLAVAKPKPSEKFQRYHSKSLSSTPLKLDDAVYDDLTSASRNHTSAILLTALDARFGCQLCREFQPEWEVIAKSWIRGDGRGESRVLFGTLDFAEGKGTFQKVLNTVYTAVTID